MVCLRAVTPALCEVMDAAATDTPDTATHVRAFIEQRLRSLVYTQAPSQLDNALWIFLIAQAQLFQSNTESHDEKVEGREDDKGTANTDASLQLPSSLRLPLSITCVQDAARWYGGDFNVIDKPPCETRQTRPAPSTQRGNSLFRDTFSKRHDAAREADARLDELLRHRYQSPPVPTLSGSVASAASTDAEPIASSPAPKPATGPLATVQLALEALSNPRRAAALRQSRSLALVVRNLTALWSLVYLCKRLRRHQQRKERLLTGEEAAAASSSSAGTTATAEPLSTCFHDYDLLLPWDLVRSVLSGTTRKTGSAGELKGETDGAEQHDGETPLTMAGVAARCRSAERDARRRCITAQTCKESTDFEEAAAAAATSPISLVINPAVTVMDDNPDRLRKNARIDAIDEAANKYYYTLLATRAHGQVGAPSFFSSPSAGAASSAAMSTGAAAAAAHKEALRSSLAAVDLGDYGVLDPSRMQAADLSGPALPVSSGFPNSSSGGSLQRERSARSYALFLRDASIGFDIQIMALTGAGVGYYMGHLRGLTTEWCTLYAVVGLVTMMLVDAVLIMIRMRRQDEAMLRARKRIRRQREKLEREGEKLVQAMQRTTAASEAVAAVQNHEPGPSHRVQEEEEKGTVVDEETDAYTKKRQ